MQREINRKKGEVVIGAQLRVKAINSSSGLNNLAQEAYRQIKKSIMDNEFKPGDFLSENTLAQALGMSRTPIREAIKVLASEGLLEIHKGVGALIKHITLKEIHDIFEVRTALECIAVDSALDRITSQELDIMEKSWVDVRDEVLTGKSVGWDILSVLDSQLHEFLLTKCDNDFIIDIISSIRMKINRFQKISASALGNEMDTINQHLEIIRLMRNYDAEGLKNELKRHILLAEELIIKNPNIKI